MLEITHNCPRMTAKRKELIMAAIFHACQLGIDKINAEIRIDFVKGLAKKEGILADCGPCKGFIRLRLDPTLPHYVLVNNVAHEMVHAKQWLTGELSFSKNNKYLLWKGKKVSSKLAYHETPWEIEAMQNEVIMAHSFSHFTSKL